MSDQNDESKLSVSITFRVDKETRARIDAIASSEVLKDAIVMRMLLEAGLGLCETKGLESVIVTRRAFLQSKKSTGKKPGAKKA